ncbi:MAG: DUF3782 domain-containing protein [Deltaproteobacteria bacterium]|nr:DUF3782 domain-containing protein [Deltaproteobacteria bacterium]
MTSDELRELILRELPSIMEGDPQMRELIVRIGREQYADKQQTESRFDRMLDELRRDREQQARKWDEQNRKWDEQNRQLVEQNRKWDEQNRKWDENQNEIRRLGRRLENAIGGLGARWGLSSEAAFREGLAAILQESFGVEVRNVREWDAEGTVFGRPDQIELDVVIHDGSLILCEIKSSMSRADVMLFAKKARWYEATHGRKADRLLIITPYADDKARAAARELGIELYFNAEDVPS